MPAEQKKPVVHLLWINSGLSCDGDSVALTAAMQPSIGEAQLERRSVMRKGPGALKVLIAGSTLAAAVLMVGAVPDMVRSAKISMM